MLVESQLDPKTAVIDEIFPAGAPWMREIRSGQIFGILDLEGQQAVDTLFYNAHDPEERYSAVDTAAGQSLPVSRYATDLHRRKSDAHHRRRHLRPA